jgi:hypothetical protein
MASPRETDCRYSTQTTSEAIMTATNLKRAFSSPESQFRHPQYVVRDSDLSYDDKIAVLRNWKLGLAQQQIEGDELDGNRRDIDSQLAAVTQAIRELRQSH